MNQQRVIQDQILIYDQEDLIDIRFGDVEKYHGSQFIAMAAVAFKALQLAFAHLSPSTPPKRGDVVILSGHPGKGIRDAFEMVTRVVTRGGYTVDKSRPKGRMNPNADFSYSFLISLAGGQADIVLKEGVIPNRFYELFGLVWGPTPTEDEKREFLALKRSIAKAIVPRPASELFTIEVTSAPAESRTVNA